MYGSICIQLIIEGDNLPVDMATPSAIELPQIKPGEKSEYKLTVANRGSNAIESVTIETALTNATSTQEIKLDKALGYHRAFHKRNRISWKSYLYHYQG